MDTKTKAREKARRLRSEAIETLGGKCVHCGFSDPRALQIDHVYADGNIEKSSGSYFAKRVKESFLEGEGRYQLLCANCNWIKRVVNEEHIARG